MTALALAALLAVAPADAAPGARRAALDARVSEAVHVLLPEVAALRELAPRAEVPVLVQEPAELRAEILADALDPESVDDLARTRATLRVFGLLPDGLALEDTVAAVLTEQIGGFYDPDELRLVLVRRDGAFTAGDLGAGSQDAMVAAHELVHALQDQHFDLWRLRNRTFTSDDADAALLALVEGDASWAMLQLTMGAAPDATADLPDALFSALVHAASEAAPDGALARLPRVLRDNLVFPYLDGLVFARTVQRARGWAGVDAAFARPPLSTEQVLHPEKYLAGDDPPLRLDLPDLAALVGPGWRTVDEDVLGELGFGSLLAQKGAPPDVRRDAPTGWGGDTYAVLAHDDGALAAVWASVWDSEADATEVALSVATLEGGWDVAVDGRRVVVLVGVPATAAPAVRAAVAGVAATPVTTLDDVSTPRPEARAAASRAATP